MQVEQNAPADDRSAMLSELRAIERGASSETSAPAPGSAEKAAPPPGDQAADAGESDVSADPDLGVEASEDDADLEQEAPEAQAAKVDPETARRLQQVQRQEKRAREGLAAERREFEAERQRWQDENRERVARAERFEKLSERAKLDLASVAKELGISEEDFEYHAEQLYRRSPKGLKDPRHKALAEQSMREREQAARLEKLEKQIEDDRKARADAETKAAQQRAADEYIGRAVKAAGADTPIVRGMLAKNPERARQRLAQAALEMYHRDGEEPDPAAVVKELEADLREWGLTPPASGGTKDASTPEPGKAKVGPKSKNPGAGEKTRPQLKQQDASGSESRPADPEQQRKEIVEALKQGTFSDE